MAKSRPDVIVVQGAPRIVDGVLSVVAKPGHVVIFGGVNDLTTSVVASAGVLRVVTENDMMGKTINDAYAVGDFVTTHIPKSGDVVQFRIPAGAAAITKSDLLKRDATGCLITGGVAADAVVEAEESVDNSGGATEVFILGRVI
jgi:hypothetical protein